MVAREHYETHAPPHCDGCDLNAACSGVVPPDR